MDLLLDAPPQIRASSDTARQPERFEQNIALRNLEPVIGLSRESRSFASEAKSWLISSLASVQASSKVYVPRFRSALTAETTDSNTALTNLISLCLGTYPQQCASVLLEELHWVKPLFSDIAGFKFGSKALANYALRHRGEVWSHLVWQGKQPHTPVVVASKPYYFDQLDVWASIQNLREQCPGFWSSPELQESLQDGQFLAIGPSFFTGEIRNMLQRKDGCSQKLWGLLHRILESHPFPRLCTSLLPSFSNSELKDFAQHLLPALTDANTSDIRGMLHALIFGTVQWQTLEELLAFCALTLHDRQLATALKDHDQQQKEVKSLLKTVAAARREKSWAAWADALKRSAEEAWRLLLLHRWALRAELYLCISSPEIFELLEANSLRPVLESTDKDLPLIDAEEKLSGKHKKGSHKQKHKKQKRGHSTVDPSTKLQVTFGGAGSVACRVADLPVLVSDRAFALWARWVLEHCRTP